MADLQYSAGINVNLNINSASNQLQNLQKQLMQISNMKIDIGAGNLTADIQKASQAAMQLSAHLATATNPKTGNLDFTKFYSSIQKSGTSLQAYGEALQRMGPAGQKAFVSLADSIAKSEIPLKRTSQMVNDMWAGLKRTAGWQLQSSIIHGFVGSIQSAVGYAKDLNSSLNDIRIVTGQSTDQMAKFAKQANQAAKTLSTTTTDYTKASLIYYQQGLSDAEVKARTEATIKMANVSGQSAEKVSSQMTAIWNNFDNGSKSLDYYGDVITALGSKTASSSQEIAQGIQKFAAISDTIGLSYEYAASALATVTATTRESADVVGNAYKTLFSRIQGLNLGETLDDGTTLNKYSTALAKVGISIKDSSGNLKNMDSILSEMGTKWDTLSKDQQTALAQTVAGVRQYTQLVALMDNWSTFQQNLQTAKSSSGTLDKQAAIYAESWEAASDRVRTSFEGLWDNLIDSKGATRTLDFFSGFIDMLNTITTGLGGAGGALSHLSAIFLKVFTPQLGASFNNIGYGIKMMFGGEAKMQRDRTDWLEGVKGALSGDSSVYDIGISQGKAYQDVLQKKIDTSLMLNQSWDKMNGRERFYAQQMQARQEALGREYIAAGEAYDQSKTALSKSYWDLFTTDEKGQAINSLDKNSQNQLRQQRDAQEQQAPDPNVMELNTDLMREYKAEQARQKAKLDAEIEQASTLSYKERMKNQASAMLDLQSLINSFGKDDGIGDFAKRFESSWKNLDEVLSATDTDKIPRGVSDFKENMKNMLDAGNIEGAKEYAAGSYEMLNNIVARTLAGEAGEELTAFIPFMSQAYQAEFDKRNYESKEKVYEQSNLPEFPEMERDRNWGEALASAAEGTMATLSLIEQLKALKEGNLSLGETIASIATSAGSAAMAITGFSAALKAIGVASSGVATGIGLLVTGLAILGSAVYDAYSEIYNADKIAAQQAAETAQATASAYKEATSYNTSLETQIQTYKDIRQAILQTEVGSTEREQLIYENNKIARDLINREGLTREANDFTDYGGEIKITDSVLERIQKQAKETVLKADITNQMAQQAAYEAILKSSKTNLDREILSQDGGVKKKAEITSQLVFGKLLESIGSINGFGFLGEIGKQLYSDSNKQRMNIINYEQDIKKGLSLVDKDSTILDKNESEFLSFFTEQGISEYAAQILLENRFQLSNYTQGLEEQKLAYELMSESLVRNIVAQNESISTLNQGEKIITEANQKYKGAYEEIQKNLNNFDNLDYNTKKQLANQVKDILGLKGLQGFQWTEEGENSLKYSYVDEDNQIQEGEVGYSSIVQAQASQAGMEAVDKYANSMANIYKQLQLGYGSDSATINGLFSALANDNFNNATTEELEAARIAASEISKEILNIVDNLENPTKTDADIQNYIKSKFGVDVDEFKELFNIDGEANLVNWFNQFSNATTLAQKLIQTDKTLSSWSSEYESISKNLTQNTLVSLYDTYKRATSLGGEEIGKSMLNNIAEVLNSSKLDVSDYNAAVQGLLAVDWTDIISSAGSAAKIIEDLGGELNTTSEAWSNFADAMALVSGAIPDFSKMFSQLTQLAGSLQKMTKGNTISAEMRDKIIGTNPEFASLFSKHYSGDYVFIGDDSQVIREAIWKSLLENQAKASQIEQQYKDYINNNNNTIKSFFDETNLSEEQLNFIDDINNYEDQATENRKNAIQTHLALQNGTIINGQQYRVTSSSGKLQVQAYTTPNTWNAFGNVSGVVYEQSANNLLQQAQALYNIITSSYQSSNPDSNSYIMPELYPILGEQYTELLEQVQSDVINQWKDGSVWGEYTDDKGQHEYYIPGSGTYINDSNFNPEYITDSATKLRGRIVFNQDGEMGYELGLDTFEDWIPIEELDEETFNSLPQNLRDLLNTSSEGIVSIDGLNFRSNGKSIEVAQTYSTEWLGISDAAKLAYQSQIRDAMASSILNQLLSEEGMSIDGSAPIRVKYADDGTPYLERYLTDDGTNPTYEDVEYPEVMNLYNNATEQLKNNPPEAYKDTLSMLDDAGMSLENFIGFATLAGHSFEELDAALKLTSSQISEQGNSFTSIFDEVKQLYDFYTLGTMAGYTPEGIQTTLDNYDNAKKRYNSWESEDGVLVNGKQVRIKYVDGQQQYQVKMGDEWKEALPADREELDLYHQADQATLTASIQAKQTIQNSIDNLKNISGDWTPEKVEEAISTLGSLSEVFDLIKGKQEGLVDSQGKLTEGTLKGIEAWAAYNNSSERVLSAIQALSIAEENLQKLNEDDPIFESVKGIRDEALAYLELQAAIDEVAAARELDAEAVATEAEKIKEQIQAQVEAGEIPQEVADNISAAAIADAAAEVLETTDAINELTKSWKSLKSALDNGGSSKYSALDKLSKMFTKIAGGIDTARLSTSKLNAITEKFANNQEYMNDILAGSGKGVQAYKAELLKALAVQDAMNNNATGEQIAAIEESYQGVSEVLSEYGDQISSLAAGQNLIDALGGSAWNDFSANLSEALQTISAAGGDVEGAMADIGDAMNVTWVKVDKPMDGSVGIDSEGQLWNCELAEDGEHWNVTPAGNPSETSNVDQAGALTWYYPVTTGGSGKGSGGGGGGGGGGGKEPKKVANKRKSQTVKRYKQNDFKRSSAQKAKKSEESKKDYLYGESKIAQMEKINKLAEKEARITADRIKESRQYLVEDRQNLIKYMQKYGFEAEFDADGFLANYEQAWTKVYEEIAALYEDNLLTEDEAKKEEELKVKLEELEGVLEDYENSLKELQEDIAAYEESLFSMYDNKVEALQHKVEFKIELSKDDLDYLDFWIESLGDSVYNALESIEAMGQKANALFDGLDTYQQGIADIMDLSDDPLQVWATGGIKDILTEDQIEQLRKNRDGLADYMKQLIKLRDEIKDKVISTFDSWQEKLDSTLNTIEHYTSVLEHFKNMIDVVGKDSLGLSDQFMANLEQSAINQSLDSIDANKAYYENLVEIQQDAQQKLDEARARGDKSSAEHWEEVVKTTTEAMEEAQESLLTSLEDTLNLIATQFENNMERAVQAFNDAIYAHGGLEGLSSDYSMIRENADLMAADYEKIYELSKITRDINKTLDDTKIVAGKQKLISLQKEINSLQNSGVELSKYDLEYLQAKYELRLAEIELENAKNAKDTVRLSRDSEGNWSYIYTQNNEAVAEAEQKYEDALYEMQKLSQEYLEEMSSKMLETSSAMMEEISNLRIQDFNSYEEYQAEIKRIQDKYAESLKLQENELNKAVSNSEALYEQDWRNYNLLTGYKISESEKWIDKFRESTIGQLLDSDTIMSSFSDTFLGLTEILTKNLADSAVSYFTNIDKAFATYGTSIKDFGKNVEESTKKISDKSKEAAGDAKTMATDMNDAFKSIAETVSSWQKEFSLQIDNMLEKIKTLIKDINEAIKTSANYQDNKNKGLQNLIGQDEAIELINEKNIFGKWKRTENGTVKVKKDDKSDYVTTSFIDFNAQLVEVIDKKIADYTKTKTGTPEREKAGAELEKLFEEYWQFRNIIDRVYDPTNVTPSSPSNNNNSNNNDSRYKFPKFTGFDTGGYTGEWGDFGKFAMLHEKELVLNKDDTKNFLDALNISRDVINSMIEMNAKQSSMAFGNLIPSSIQDTSQILEQTVTIQAEFPNATDHSEIEEAFNNLINTASQYANRR